MANDTPDNATNPGAAKIARAKPIKTLPTARIPAETQLKILRAYAAAAGHDRNPVSNIEVGKVADLSDSSISMCNPFFVDAGLIAREGNKQRPSEAVIDYHTAWEWDPEAAGKKLAPILSGSWFWKALSPKVAFRALTRDEAVQFLADEAKASREYKDQLAILLDYLRSAGLISVDGNSVTKGTTTARPFEPPAAPDLPPAAREIKPSAQAATDPVPDDASVERFTIPLPEKASATIIVPKSLDADDWEMLVEMMETYISRWKKFERSQRKKQRSEKGEAEDGETPSAS